MNRRERRGRRGRGKRERLQEWRINIQETGFLTLKAAMQYFHKNPVSEFRSNLRCRLAPDGTNPVSGRVAGFPGKLARRKAMRHRTIVYRSARYCPIELLKSAQQPESAIAQRIFKK
ncbi:MAG: hypothetical protein HC786_33250 [Richelia sp. CSU_2_1]|nr:hypothetical protein [Microcoleus sp. SU_5_6]NJR26619.1 hypothetical protein [Richelia sp. CSU_2_1]